MNTTTHQRTPRSSDQKRIEVAPARRRQQDPDVALITSAAAQWLAVTRIVLGLIFVWAFLDKTFGLGYATPSARAWINGGSPTGGFLSHVEVGPFAGAFQALAGNALVDWLFMIGLLGIGAALTLGVGLRVAAVAGAAMMILMWAAEWPPALITLTGDPSGSVNPLLDYHLVYGLVLAVLATTGAGRVWGLASAWQRTRFVHRFPWTG